MAEGGYSQNLSQHLSQHTDEGGGDGPVGVGSSDHPRQHASPHHVSHTSSHSSQASHPHPHHAVVHGSPVRGGSAEMLSASPARVPTSHTHTPQHHKQPIQRSPQAQQQQQQGPSAGSSSSTSWSNIPLAINNGDSRNSLDEEGKLLLASAWLWCYLVSK